MKASLIFSAISCLSVMVPFSAFSSLIIADSFFTPLGVFNVLPIL